MYGHRVLVSLSAMAVLYVGGCTLSSVAQTSSPEETLVKKARAIHEHVLTLDTHVDISPSNFSFERNYTQRLDTQVNLPKMAEGGLDAVFFSVFVGQTREAQHPDAFKAPGYERAYKAAIEKFDAIHRLTEQIAPDRIELALTSADVRRIYAKGKKVALIGVENGYPIGDDIGRVKEFYDRGARYMSLAHNGHSQLSDSHTGERDGWKWSGLSPFGKQVIVEMNRVGIMIDVSHPSEASMMQSVALSKAPLIASHSAVRALCDVSRNMNDEQLLALKRNGGVIQIVAYASYIKTPKPDSAERAAALATLRKEFNLPDPPAQGQTGSARSALAQLSLERRAEYDRKLAEIDKKYPGDPPATVRDFIDHIDYAVKLIGIDHVGIASDFEGGGGVSGWNDASETFNVTLELARRGYTEEEIGKLWGGNLLRVMDEVQRIAHELQKS
ncbi:MAG TPA: dipeptidase [Methylomirabilota bacterium]|nr:dipeptidase [Methylomirabilota bacterium]